MKVLVDVSSTGVLDLRATGDVLIEGTIDLSGGNGASYQSSSVPHAGGGQTGTVRVGINNGNAPFGGLGGTIGLGQNGVGGDGHGGQFGGGASGGNYQNGGARRRRRSCWRRWWWIFSVV